MSASPQDQSHGYFAKPKVYLPGAALDLGRTDGARPMRMDVRLTTALPLLFLKHRNATLDFLFYDTSSLSHAEAIQMAALIEVKGGVIAVSPSVAARPIRHYERVSRFMDDEGDTVRAIAVAGVGSSVLGTAALARNVADALNCDVAGVVTSRGLSDAYCEALAGWFLFGGLEHARLEIEDLVGDGVAGLLDPDLADMSGFEDVAVLASLMASPPPKLEFLIGHSKGSLLIDFVLDQFMASTAVCPSALFETLNIITLGTVVGISDRFRHVHQYLGALDWFGGFNSCLDRPYVKVEGAWHHLNTQVPYHLDVGSVLRTFHGAGAGRSIERLAAPGYS